MREQVYNRHKSCSCSIRLKKFSNGVITPALVCDAHNTYIDWLTNQAADMLHRDLAVPYRSWVDKKARQKNKTKQNLRRQQMNKYVSGQIKRMYSKKIVK